MKNLKMVLNMRYIGLLLLATLIYSCEDRLNYDDSLPSSLNIVESIKIGNTEATIDNLSGVVNFVLPSDTNLSAVKLIMKSPQGVTLSPEDITLCKSKGHTIKEYDLSFLPQKDGYYDESVDFVFLRHALEHSPYPIFSLMEYNRILKQGAKMYIEVPAPDCERKHEWNLNHYSILGEQQLAALLDRTGFKIDLFQQNEFVIQGKNGNGEDYTAKEKYFCITVTKSRPLDIK